MTALSSIGLIASSQTFEINSLDPATGPYYPFDTLNITYDNSLATPDSIVYYFMIDIDADGELDADDEVLAQGESDAGTLEGRLPYLPDATHPLRVIAGTGGTLGDDITTSNISSGSLLLQGESTTTYPIEMTEGGIERQIHLADNDFSGGNNYTLIIDFNTSLVTVFRDVIIQYSVNDGLDYVRLATIDGQNFWRQTSGKYYLPIPAEALTSNTDIRITQPNSALSTDFEDMWTVNSIALQSSDGTFIQYESATYGSIYISEPDILVTNTVRDDTVGRSFSIDYEARGFLDGATYYYYTGDIYDSNNRTIFEQSTDDTGTFSGQWPFEDADDIDSELRLAAIYGNIDEPTVYFDNASITKNGSDQTNFPYNFNKNVTRSLRTGAVDINGEEYASIEIRFGAVSTLSVNQRINLQYSLDGSTWVTLDSIFGGGLSSSTYRFDLEGEVLSSNSRFRLLQSGSSLGSSLTWQVNGMEIDQFEEQLDKLESERVVKNYQVEILEVLDDALEATSSGFPGDEITVEALVHGFDPSARTFSLVLDETYVFENVVQTITGDNVTITADIPKDILYDTEMSLQVLIYEGSEVNLGLNTIIFSDYTEEHLTIEGGDYQSSRVDFSSSGDRSLTLPELEIAATDDLTLTFDLQRLNSVRSPSGTEVVLEYSTGAGFTTVSTYSINEAGTSGITYEVTSLPAEAISNATIFQFRQLANNGEDLDTWRISNISVNGGSSIYRRSYLDYDAFDLTINSPSLTLGAINSSGTDLYPGASFTNSLQISGAFPTGTSYSLYMVREDGHSILLDERTSAGTFSSTVPAVVPGNYNLMVTSDYGDIESNVQVISVLQVDINGISISSTDALVDGSNSIVYPTSTIDIVYAVVGPLTSGASATLEVYDHTAHVDGYVTLVSGESVDGTISAELPIGIDYDGDPELRLKIENGNLEYVSSSIDADWGEYVTQYRIEIEEDPETHEEIEVMVENDFYSEKYFPADTRAGHTSENEYSETGVRKAESVEFDFSEGTANVQFDFSISGYSGNQMLYLQYSTEDEVWEHLDSVKITTSNRTNPFPDFISLPEEAQTTATKLRFIFNEDEAAVSGENVLYFSGFSITEVLKDPIATEDFNLSIDLLFEELSLSISNLGAPTYKLGQTFTVEYNADGPFASDIGFAVVLTGTGASATSETLVIGESTATGAVDVSSALPFDPAILEELETEHDASFNLSVIPYKKSGTDTVYRAAARTTSLDEAENFDSWSGSDESTTPFSFNLSGNRYLLTDTLDLTTTDEVTLTFDYTYTGGTPTSLLVLPLLQITNDGEEFVTLTIDTDQSDYGDDGYLFNSRSYTIEIPDSLTTSTTQIRWYQELNRGAGQNVWTIANVLVTEGSTNAFTSFVYGPNENQTINIMEPDIANFVWKQNDPTDAVFNGETFDYSWDYDTSEIDFNTFPDGTEFVFSLDGVTDPTTGSELILATTTSLGVDEIDVPSYVERGSYSIGLTAYVTTTDIDGEEVTISFYEDEDIPDAVLEVYNKVVTTSYTGTADPIYAGNTATFSITLENNETNNLSVDDLYATLLVLDFEGDDDLILHTQLGVADMVVDLPPYLRGGSFEFVAQLSENQPLGEVGEIGNFDYKTREGDIVSISSDLNNFITGDVGPFAIISKAYTEDDFGSIEEDPEISFKVDFSSAAGESLIFEYALNNGTYTIIEDLGSGSRSGETFTYDVPTEIFDDPSTYQNITFRWKVGTDDGSLDGSSLTISSLSITDIGSNLENSGGLITENAIGSKLEFANDFGRGLITTRDFAPEEISDVTMLMFDLSFAEAAEEITTNEFLVLEYSQDGGVSFDPLDTYPAAGSDALSNEKLNVTLSDPMKADSIRFRFRQEERGGIDVAIRDLSFRNTSPIPFDYQSESQNIANQAVLITGFDDLESCYSDTLTLNYEIRGTFGESTEMKVEVIGETIGTKELEEAYAITGGSGSISFDFPSALLAAGANNESLKFRLVYEDNTVSEYTYTGSGVSSEESIELIAPINQSLSFSWDDPLECASNDVMLNLTGIQDYFMYEAINKADDSVLGSLTFDPESSDPEINIGSLTDDVKVYLRVTSMSSSGSVCNTLSLAETKEVEILSTYQLFRRGYNDVSQKIVVNTEDSRVICGASSEVRLSVNRNAESEDGSSSFIEWFLNDLSTPVTIVGDILGDNESLVTGSYFARVTDTSGDTQCVYLTESFDVTVEETPDRPEITLDSGSLTFCEGEDEAVLSAPSGFSYYRWYKDGGPEPVASTMSITVDESGSYTVAVSNVPFDLECASATSIPVIVETQALPDLRVNAAGTDIIAGGTYNACGELTLTFTDGPDAIADDGEFEIMKDGAFYASTSADHFEVTDSGSYSVTFISADINATCSVTVGDFNLVINEKPEQPSISVGGSLSFCEGGSVTLTATSGYQYYQWIRDGNVLNINAASLTVTKNSGSYQVQVANIPFTSNSATYCASDPSEEVKVTVYEDPDISLSSNVNGFGELGDGDVLEICSSSDAAYLRASAGGYPVTWYMDGAAIESADLGDEDYSYVYPTDSGAYHAEVVIGDGSSVCTYTSVTVNVNYTTQPAKPAITSSGDLSFCEGGSVTLSATAGFDYYQWTRDGDVLNISSSSLTVTKNSGTYRVQVSDTPFGAASGTYCASDPSPGVKVTVYNDPDISLSSNVNGFSELGDGDVLEICSSSDAAYLRASAGGYPVTWYMDGAAIESA
ncbi:MAG: hypothetical protein RIC35_09655, partial [Marinoscillum sp.]